MPQVNIDRLAGNLVDLLIEVLNALLCSALKTCPQRSDVVLLVLEDGQEAVTAVDLGLQPVLTGVKYTGLEYQLQHLLGLLVTSATTQNNGVVEDGVDLIVGQIAHVLQNNGGCFGFSNDSGDTHNRVVVHPYQRGVVLLRIVILRNGKHAVGPWWTP